MTPADRYLRCERLVIGWEGGARYTDHPKDPGGPTRFGVTLKALSEWRGRPCTAQDVRDLTEDVALAIYKAKYWVAVKGDALPAGVDLFCFDAAVNCGRGRAARWLQHALGVAVDGDIGKGTLRALGDASAHFLIEDMREERLAFYRSLGTYPTFGRGWENRLAICSAQAQAWAA